MRKILICSTFAGLALGQGLIEKALVTGAGATAASRSGQQVGAGVSANLGGLAGALASSAGGGGSKPSPFGEATPSRRATDLPQVPNGPEAAVGASPMPSSRRKLTPDVRPDRVVTAQPMLEDEDGAPAAQPAVARQAATPAPVPPRPKPAPEPARRVPTVDEVRSVAVGSAVADAVNRLGLPASRFAMWEDGHLNETLRYESTAGMLGRIKSVDGKIVSVETAN